MSQKGNRKDYITGRSERLSYWSYFIGQNISYALMVMILPTYLLMTGVGLAKIATVILLVKTWDAVNDVFFGILFDRIKFKSGNKCIPWIRLSAICLPVGSLLMYLLPGGSGEMFKLVWFVVAYILWDTAYTLTDVPIYSLVFSMTNNLAERNSILSTGRVFATATAGITFMICTVLISEQVGMGFRTVALIFCAIMLLSMIPMGITARERIVPETATESYTLRGMFKYLKSNKYLLLFFSGYVISGVLSTSSAVELFVSYYLFGSALFSTVMYAIMAGPMLLVAILTPGLLRRFDKFRLFRNCIIACVALGLISFVIGYGNMTLYLIMALLRAIPLAVVGVLGLTFTPDCVEYGLYKTGIDARGIAFALQSFAAKFGSVAQSVGLFVLGVFGWVTIEAASFADLEVQHIVQSSRALNGLWITYLLVPTIGGLLSLIPYFMYKLNDKDIQIMAKCNSGEISKETAEGQLSGKL